ncbi:S-layer homology domain-containing protein [Faecalispora jeddahensis]|uniref:S-layer homology domain-containing protein n=1 Tax=Faecalispora jeddahensis TaxID=1414721 RepID=UPI00189A7228|nr:S-layer homology domain-containing protein [Faecalispora jeddahensis]
MNTRKITHGLSALILMLVLIFGQTTTALAMGPDDPAPVTVSTFDELVNAIEQAEPGGTIEIQNQIIVPANSVIGSPHKHLNIQRMDTATGTVLEVAFSEEESIITVQNITFDGADISGDSFFISHNEVNFQNVEFQNCVTPYGGAAVCIRSGNATFNDCAFRNNTASMGGHIDTTGGTGLYLNRCTLTGGLASERGGAINLGSNGIACIVESCTICGNESGNIGGAIYNRGNLTITGSKIFNNTNKDICNDNGSVNFSDSLEVLMELYQNDGLIPAGWSEETVENRTFYTMTFADPEPEPTPDPEPIPDPTPTPTPEPDDDDDEPASRPSHSGAGSTKPTVTTPKAPLTCGKAVFDHTKTDYLLGYADGLMGQENAVTRAQMAQTIYRLLTADSRAAIQSNTTSFTDVPKDAWYYEAVCSLEKAGIISGNSNGKFGPDQKVTWGEMITMFYRFVDHKPVSHIITTHWARNAINSAIDFLWIDYTDQFKPDGFVTRSEMVQFAQGVFAWAKVQQ